MASSIRASPRSICPAITSFSPSPEREHSSRSASPWARATPRARSHSRTASAGSAETYAAVIHTHPARGSSSPRSRRPARPTQPLAAARLSKLAS